MHSRTSMKPLTASLAVRWSSLRAVLSLLLALTSIVFSTGTSQEPPSTTPPPQAAATPLAVPAYRQARNVAVITIKGEIDAGGRFRESVMVASVQRRINAAVRAGADAIVFEIDSPGGEVGAALRLGELIKECPIKNTVAWIHTRALSGGAVVALSCREVVVTEGSTFGDAMPVGMGPNGMQPVEPEMLKKVLPVLISSVVDSARRHNEVFGSYRRDEYLTQAIVANDVALWWVRNPATGVEMAIDRREFEFLFPGKDPEMPARLASIRSLQPLPPAADTTADLAPTDELPGVPAGSEKLAIAREEAERQQAVGAPVLTIPTARPLLTASDAGQWELVDRITDGSAPATFSALDLAHYNFASNAFKGADGRVVLQPINTDNDLKAFFAAEQVRRLDKNWSEGLVVFLTHPLVRGLFIAVFIICLFIEMSHPGASLPGAIAIIALLLAIAPSMMLGLASWWEVAAIVLGIALLALEVFVLPGFGIPGILGLILLFAGLLGTFIPAGNGFFPSGQREQGQVLWGLSSILAAVVTSGIAIYFIARHIGNVPFLNKFILKDAGTDEESAAWAATNLADLDAPAKIGDTGAAVTPLRPTGKAEINGQVLEVIADSGWLERGAKVKVVSISGLRIGVEPI